MPSAPVAPIVKLEVAPPVKYWVPDIPETVPFNVNVLAPIVNVFPAAAIENIPVMVGPPPDIVNAVAPTWFSSRFPKVAVLFDILFAAPVMDILPPALLVCVPAPVIFPALVITLPPSANVPAVSASVVATLQLLPNVAVCPALFIVKVTILFVVPGVVGLKNKVPRSLVELIVRLDVAPPVRYWVVDIPDTVPFNVRVKAPMVKVLFAPVKDMFPFTVGLPVSVNALAEAELKSRLP